MFARVIDGCEGCYVAVQQLPVRVDVIGVPISATNMEECMGLISSGLDSMRGSYICVSNAHACVMAHDDPSYWACQAESTLSIPDGKPLSVVGRKQISSMARVTGPDLMREIFAVSAKNGWKHYFYGNKQENLDALRVALERDYPGLEIVAMEPSVFRPLSNQEKTELCERINNTNADFAWIALGAPRQEVFMHELKGKTNSLMVGVGGAFNVLAGIVSDAPQWMKDHGLEWFYRFMQEPGRLWKRYLATNFKFIFYNLAKTPRKEG